MQTTKIKYELPQFLPFGWMTAVATTLGIHRHTVRNAIRQGDTHPMYRKIIAVIRNTYGVPTNIKKEETC